MKRILREIADLFVPPLCAGCGRMLQNPEVPACMACMVSMPRCTPDLCGQVLLPVMVAAPCAPALAMSWTPYEHDSIGARLIRSVKYYGRPRAGYELGRVFASELIGLGLHPGPAFLDPASLPPGVRPVDSHFGIGDVELLLPVPQHWTKTLRRGFNQSRCIALGMAAATGARVVDNLVASRAHRTQTHRSGQDRMRNVTGTVRLDRPEELAGRHIAIVDDVITTGATIRECIIAIGRSGALPASLSVFSLGLAARG